MVVAGDRATRTLMAGYDPQRSRRRPSAAETGEAPVDSLLAASPTSAAAAAGASTPAGPTVTPPPPTPDPDPRLVSATMAALALAVLLALWWVRRWWRGRGS